MRDPLRRTISQLLHEIENDYDDGKSSSRIDKNKSKDVGGNFEYNIISGLKTSI